MAEESLLNIGDLVGTPETREKVPIGSITRGSVTKSFWKYADEKTEKTENKEISKERRMDSILKESERVKNMEAYGGAVMSGLLKSMTEAQPFSLSLNTDQQVQAELDRIEASKVNERQNYIMNTIANSIDPNDLWSEQDFQMAINAVEQEISDDVDFQYLNKKGLDDIVQSVMKYVIRNKRGNQL